MYESYRCPGEFEPVSDVFVSWLPDYINVEGYDIRKTAVEIIRSLMEHATVHVNCGSEGLIEKARARLKEEGVDIDKLVFSQIKDPECYLRDNGPSFMVDDKGGRMLVAPNWSFYSVGSPEDESCRVTRRAGVQLGVELDVFDVVSSDFVSEGGDREFNGRGVMMCIEDTEVRKRNPGHTREEVEAEYRRLFNVEKFIWIPQPVLEDDDLRMGPLEYKEGNPVFGSSFAAHVDEMARFVDASTILLAEITEEEARASEAARETKRRLDAALEVIESATDVDGNHFKVVRMPVPEPVEFVLTPGEESYEAYKAFVADNDYKFQDGTPWPEAGPVHFYAATGYCNFLICNGLVLGQRYYHEGMPLVVREKDEKAKTVLQSVFPDRTIEMVDALPLNLSGGGVHCWTKDAPAPCMKAQ